MQIIPILVLVSTIASAQKLDSLLNQLQSANHDTTRLKVLDAIIEDQSQDYAAIEKYSIIMQDLSTKNAEAASGELRKFFLHYHGTALNNLAYVEENKSNNPGALASYEKALDTFREIDDKAGIAMCLTNLGFVSKKTGDLSKAIEYYDKAAQINKEIDNKSGYFAAVNNVGMAFYQIGDLKKSLTSYFEALRIAEEMNDKRRVARIYNNIAGAYYSLNELPLYRQYIEKSLAIAEEVGDRSALTNSLVNYAYELVKEKNFDKAREYSARVVKVGEELKDNAIIAEGLSSLSTVNRETGNFQAALELETKALNIKRGLNNTSNIQYSLTVLGDISRHFNKIDDAIRYYNEALAVASRTSYLKGISRSTQGLSEIYKQKGNTTKALEYYEIYIKMRDSINNEASRKASFKSQYKYEYEIKATADSIRAQGEKAVLNAQLSQEKSQRYALTAVFILGVTLAGFIFYRFRVTQEMKELQLRNRIASDLHDEVGSAISSISLFAGMARMKSGSESSDIVAKIENTSRETVDNMSDIVWSIEPSNDRFDNVLRKMTYFGEQLMGSLGIGFTFNYEPGMEKTVFDMAKRKNIYLIYKEAINNAAKYSGAKNVNARLWKEGRQYAMEIKDDGKGFDTSSGSAGNGLRNMKRRAEEMSGSLAIESSDKGTTITLKV
ncbi:MAG: tetratricopeptide repeat protein [Bacteroidota bacterium]